MAQAPTVLRGLLVDVKVGEQVVIHAADDESNPVTITVEHKSGRIARFRLQAAKPVRLSLPGKDR